MPCDCLYPVSLPRGVVGWSAVYDGGVLPCHTHLRFRVSVDWRFLVCNISLARI